MLSFLPRPFNSREPFLRFRQQGEQLAKLLGQRRIPLPHPRQSSLALLLPQREQFPKHFLQPYLIHSFRHATYPGKTANCVSPRADIL